MEQTKLLWDLLVKAIENYSTDDSLDASIDKTFAKFRNHLNEYQEQPTLLDKVMPQFVKLLTDYLLSHCAVLSNDSGVNDLNRRDENEHILQSIFGLLYFLCKVRGAKFVVRFFPHSANLLEKVLDLVCDITPEESWEKEYICFIWLSILVIIPFDLKVIDSCYDNEKPIADRIINRCYASLSSPGVSGDAAAETLSIFLSRSDIDIAKLENFIEESLQTIKSDQEKSSVFMRNRKIASLCSLLKHSPRERVLPFVDKFIVAIQPYNGAQNEGLIQRKNKVKLAGLIGLLFLKPRAASWKYRQGVIENETIDDTGTEDVPEGVEVVLDHVLIGLEDVDTAVRWTAAKAVATLCNRLPYEFAAQVLESILSLFTSTKGEGSWHGGCLAVAEMARRGLLLPVHIASVVNVLEQALIYDVRKGTTHVGSNVRDAACYVCWAFARAFAPAVLKPYVQRLGGTMLTVALFDREINCRRAAAAALQENVGRQKTYPQGIELVTTVDYFSVSNREKSFTSIASKIIAFPEYQTKLVEYLFNVKSKHWDPEIRELTASSIAEICAVSPEYIISACLPAVIESSLSGDIDDRHGSILAVSGILQGFAKNSMKHFVVDSITLEKIIAIPIQVDALKLMTGKGAEIIRIATLKLIASISICKITLPVKLDHLPPTIGNQKQKVVKIHLQTIIDDSLYNNNTNIQEAAAKCLKEFSIAYHTVNAKSIANYQKLVDNYVENTKIDSATISKRRGACLALGSLTKDVLNIGLDTIITALQQASMVQENAALAESEDPITRKYAVLSLSAIVETYLQQETVAETPTTRQQIFHGTLDCLIKCMDDYAVDNRGDVGSWVRIASMESITAILSHATALPFIDSGCFDKILAAFIKQAAESLDNVRIVSINSLRKLLSNGNLHALLEKSCDSLLKLKDELEACTNLDAFNVLVSILHPNTSECIRFALIKGLFNSLGGRTFAVAESAAKALATKIEILPAEEYQSFWDLVIELMNSKSLPELEIIKALATISKIHKLKTAIMEAVSTNVKDQIRGSKDIHKLFAAISFFSYIVQLNPGSKLCGVPVLLAWTAHSYPKIRQYSAEELVRCIDAMHSRNEVANGESIKSLLQETDWLSDPAKHREIRQKLYQLLELPVVVRSAKESDV